MLRAWRPSRVPYAVAFVIVATSSCTSILGVEDLHENPRPGSGGATENAGETSGGSPQAGHSDGGTPPKGGSSGTGGRSSRGGAENSAGNEASLAGAGGSPTPDQGGAPSGGSDIGPGGSTNEGGDNGGDVEDGSVRGTVIDFLGHEVPNVSVTVGETTVLTDAQGRFEIETAPERYDVHMVVSFLVNNAPGTAHWAYLGLSRRDPTLQVYRALDNQDADAHVVFSNGNFDSSHATALAVGTENGSSLMNPNYPETTFLGGIRWYGPRATQGRAHALLWSVDANDLPVGYDAFAELVVAAEAGGEDTEIPITFPDTALQARSVSGGITAASAQSRTNYAFLHFTTNAAIPIVEDDAGPNTFSYLVPSLPNSVITVAASTGNSWGPFALAHKSVAAGQSGVALAIPSAPVLGQPAPDTQEVGTDTTFQWSTDAAVSLLWIEDVDYYRSTYVLTGDKQVKLPSFGGGSPLRSGGAQVWKVEISGGWNSIDEATGPGGFQDAFAARHDEPVGPRRDDGTFAVSEGRGFTAK